MRGNGFERLDRLLRDRIETERLIPGAVILVRMGGGVLFHEAYGLRQRIPVPLPMTRETLFDLASLTKPVGTTLGAMLLWQEGGLGLDDAIGRYFTGFEDPQKREIACRHLLSHCSGLPAWRPYYQEYPESRCDLSMDEVVRRVLLEPLEAPPGKKEVYSDLGFILLGRILEGVTGHPLDRFLRERLFEPLGLEMTGYRRPGSPVGRSSDSSGGIAATEYCRWRKRVLVGEVHDENCYLVGGVSGHAGLFTTARELDRIVMEIFCALDGSSLLFRATSVRAFFRRQGRLAGGTWALGWDTPSPVSSTSGRYFSKNSYGHNGFTGTSLWMDLDRRIAVVLLTNRVHPDRENLSIRQLRPEVHDAVLKELLGI